MASKELNVKVKHRYDTASNWTTNNPVLLAGELGIESDTRKMKVGDGTTNWSSLKYITVNDLSDYVTLNTDQEISGVKKIKLTDYLSVWLESVLVPDKEDENTLLIQPAILFSDGTSKFHQTIQKKTGTIALLDDLPDMSLKMDKDNPTGTGSFSLNRSTSDAYEVGNYSFAEGYNCGASETASHAEGFSTISTGRASHSEGISTRATGSGSHAEGNTTLAGGNNSHTEGFYTTATRRSQHVFGEYNMPEGTDVEADTLGTYIEIVGNGQSATTRSNARTLDWDGNEYLAGNLQANGLTDGTTTKSMTEVLAGGGTNIIWREWT